MDEVDVQPVDLGCELRQRIQSRLTPAPVVFVLPVARELLNRRQLHALLSIRHELLGGQARGSDPTVQDHLGDLYQKTGRLKLAAAHWERALNEWNKTVAAELDPGDVAKVQKKLESAKVKLAKEDSGNK